MALTKRGLMAQAGNEVLSTESVNVTDHIRRLTVDGLYGRFNHEVRFEKNQNIVILTAPNGYGKTAMLRIIDSFFNRKLNFFRRTEFEEIDISFYSKKSVKIYKIHSEQTDNNGIHDEDKVFFEPYGFPPDAETFPLSSHMKAGTLRYTLRFLERNFRIERSATDSWFDHSTGDMYSTEELIDRYAHLLPEEYARKQMPEWLRSAISSVKVHLVETQRLLSLDDHGDQSLSGRYRRPSSSSVVENDAADLSKRISLLLQKYANFSQMLDQSFPTRIIRQFDDEGVNITEIEDKLQELSERRQQLVSAGVLDESAIEPIQPSEAFRKSKAFTDPSLRKMLSLYVEDTNQKLDIFNSIYPMIDLFKQIINEHFSYKLIKINLKKGIFAVDSNTGRPIKLTDLSSGEQHILVLIYELLFKMKKGATILIDEPELSLHIGWQRSFIFDLQNIQKLNNMDVVIATHSPQIIGKYWNYEQELKDS